MGCWCGRRVHRLPQSVWDEFVVGLNLSAEAGMSVDEGSGEDRDQCLFWSWWLTTRLSLSHQPLNTCISAAKETYKLPCVYLKQRRRGTTWRAWEADREAGRWGNQDRWGRKCQCSQWLTRGRDGEWQRCSSWLFSVKGQTLCIVKMKWRKRAEGRGEDPERSARPGTARQSSPIHSRCLGRRWLMGEREKSICSRGRGRFKRKRWYGDWPPFEEMCGRDAGCFATSSSPRVRDRPKVLSAGCGDLLSLLASSSAGRGITRRLHVLTTAAHWAQGRSESKLHLVLAPGHLSLCTLPSERSRWK